MPSAHCLVSGAIIGVTDAPGRDRVIVTIDGDGVSCYDVHAKVRTLSTLVIFL